MGHRFGIKNGKNKYIKRDLTELSTKIKNTLYLTIQPIYWNAVPAIENRA